MPNIKSAKKRVLITERNRLRNQAYKSAIRTSIKRVLESLQKGHTEDSQALLSKMIGLIDKGILKGILHKNTGARTSHALPKRLIITQLNHYSISFVVFLYNACFLNH